MKKDAASKTKDVKDIHHWDNQGLINEEIRFSKELDRFHPEQIHSPIGLFIKNFKYEKL